MREHAAALLLGMYGRIISDEEAKNITGMCDKQKLKEAIAERGPPFNDRDIEAFIEDGDDEGDEQPIIDKYAQFIKNYQYNYNDKALAVDPSIDTEQVHIGPMAQDIEQVNPACVVEDPKTGMKEVDAGRLALMNAGAIAELARKINGTSS